MRLARLLGGTRPTRRDPLGPAGERAALRHLKRSGYRRLGANVRTHAGEIDLIMLAPDKRTIVFVEVKARRSAGDGGTRPPPEASVHAGKRAKLRLLANQIARDRGWQDRPLRIDVVAVEWVGDAPPAIRHHENAVAG
ncbi:MAG: YraN family protein [Phycisphaerales bacterium]